MPPDLYGGFALERGDHDRSEDCAPPVWGGQARGASHRHVEELQRDLHKLGFQVVGAIDGVFDRRTEWGVREFQIYARMAQVAREDPRSTAARYADRLSPIPTGPHRYSGPASGVVNGATRETLGHWLDQCWRCPVIVEGWSLEDGRPHTLNAANVWWHDEVVNKALRIFVRDFSGYYDLASAEIPDGLIVLGDYATYLDWSGPRSVPPRHTWPSGEILPEALVGAPLDALSPPQRSTYKVIRAVSEVECLGFFDCLNAYDNAFLSIGPAHWTLGIVNRNRTVSDGELCGFLGYLRHADQEAFERAVGFFGVEVDRGWVTRSGAPSGEPFFDARQKKYAGWLSLECEDGGFARVEKSEEEGNYFKTWHWFYRFSMAGRTIAGYRRRMWDMARIRIRDLRKTVWGSGVTSLSSEGGRRPARIGDVFTSEKALGMLLRWHVRFPSHVVSAGLAGARIKSALDRAREARLDLDWRAAPDVWTHAHEAALLDGLRAEATATTSAGFIKTIADVDRWPSWAEGENPRRYALSPEIGALLESRGSFAFDESGLPPPPSDG